jgi:hypothetical protein
MPSYPRPCPRCGVVTEKSDFPVDSSKASGHKSYCKDCDRRYGRSYFDSRRDELYAQREAVREAAWQAELEALVEEHQRRVAAGSPEEITERARRWPTTT